MERERVDVVAEEGARVSRHDDGELLIAETKSKPSGGRVMLGRRREQLRKIARLEWNGESHLDGWLVRGRRMEAVAYGRIKPQKVRDSRTSSVRWVGRESVL